MLPMRLFANPVFTVCSILSFIVGFAMLGAMTYLPTYLQYVDGDSATVSGVRTLPMVIGLLIASVVSGNVVSRTGQYRLFPIAGSLVMGLGLFLMSLMGPSTGAWLESLYMFVLGTGIGLCMQVLTIAVQNTVEYADLGTATSGVTFFRTLGSSFGTAVFGTIYTNSLTPNLKDGIASAVQAGGGGLDAAAVAKAATSPDGLHRLPSAVAAPIIDAYADTLRTVFLWTVPVAALGFVVALFLQQVQLRDSARAGSTDLGEGFASPSGADSQRVLENAVGKIIGSTDLDTARRIITDSDTRLDIAGAWAVMQVELHTRMVGHASLGMIAARRHLPPEVLLPVFDRMVEEGYLTRAGHHLSHTEGARARPGSSAPRGATGWRTGCSRTSAAPRARICVPPWTPSPNASWWRTSAPDSHSARRSRRQAPPPENRVPREGAEAILTACPPSPSASTTRVRRSTTSAPLRSCGVRAATGSPTSSAPPTRSRAWSAARAACAGP